MRSVAELIAVLYSRNISVRPPVCLSVCHMLHGVVTKRIQLNSQGFHRRIAPSS